MLAYVHARQKAAELLRDHWDGTLPVKLAAISESLKAMKLETELGSISGMVVKEAHEPAKIFVNENEPASRRRFTWAHELGHIVERREIAKDNEYSFSDLRSPLGYDLHEFYADEFAGSLLMPADTLLRLQSEGKTREQIADIFQVSPAAVDRRIARLEKHPERAS